jgi:hypothetical protein
MDTTKAETRTCQNCKISFDIEPDDFAFYEKIAVPPPTFCPDCRRQRRFSFRNERTLYKRSCDLCHKDIISLYPADAPFPVYCNPCWYSDKWDPEAFGIDYDPSKTFFAQFHDLLKRVPRPALIGSNNVDSPYVNYSMNLKNCYLLNCCESCEQSGYSDRAFYSKEIFDCFGAINSEFCYENNQGFKNFHLKYAANCENMLDSAAVYNCRNGSHCIGCINLRNQKYHYLNQPISKEEYEKKAEELGSHTAMMKLKSDVRELALRVPHRFAEITLSKNSDGNELAEAKNCHHCFFIRGAENLKYAYFGSNLKDGYDFNFADNSELIYESSNIEKNYNEMFSLTCWLASNVTYSDLCQSSMDMFGCVGVRSKQYDILNRQYSKEDYEALKAKIVGDMKANPYIDAKGRAYGYGEFFPSEISPFAYNETIAQDHFPLTKATAGLRGYRWRDAEARTYAATTPASALPDHINEASDTITKDVVGCAHNGECVHQCSTAFRITLQELQFYRQMNIPLPWFCPNCRYYERLAERSPMQLWTRACQCAGERSEDGIYQNTAQHFHAAGHCKNQFQTPYAPERPEIVYCEQCYQAEVS